MPYAASYSTRTDIAEALEAVCTDVAHQLNHAVPDVSFLFVSPHHAPQAEQIAELVFARTGSRHLLGCHGESIAALGKEIESTPAVSLWSAVLPGAELESFHAEFSRTPDGLICQGLPELSSENSDKPPVRAMFLLGDPYSCHVPTLINLLAEEMPGVPLLGGMASGGQGQGELPLYWNDQCIERGGVGLIVRGGPSIRSIVSQGCRQVGSTYVVTKSNQNVIFEMGGKPALARFEELFESLSPRDRSLVQKGLHLGIVMDEHQPRFERGDFLISNVVGADQESGAIAIGNLVRPGQTVQFHVRDADTANEDLQHLLAEALVDRPAPQAALLFSCNGRGTRLFPQPDHDAGLIQTLYGPLPLAGFFAAGELGPVGGKNYIHGYTASVALFE